MRGSCAVTGRSSSGTTTNVRAKSDEKSAATDSTAAPVRHRGRLTLESPLRFETVQPVSVRVGDEDLVGFADAERLRELDVDRRARSEVLRLHALAVREQRLEVRRVQERKVGRDPVDAVDADVLGRDVAHVAVAVADL